MCVRQIVLYQVWFRIQTEDQATRKCYGTELPNLIFADVEDDTPKFFFSQKTEFDASLEKDTFVAKLKCYGYKTTPQ